MTPTRRPRLLVAALVAAGGLAVAGVGARQLLLELEDPELAGAEAPTASATAPGPSAGPKNVSWDGYSNIYRQDYVGPEACRKCHEPMVQKWREHPHSRMNAIANGASVVGDFSGESGAKLDYADGSAQFETRTGEYLMNISRRGELLRRYRVTRTVGSRFVQMYVGVQIEGPEPRSDAVYTQEGKLPFAYWIERKMWFPQTYDEAPHVAEYRADGALDAFYAFYDKRTTGTWQRTCILCHNTFPYAARFDAVGQGKVLGFPEDDIALSPKREDVRDGEGQPILEPWELVTVGISCESCHFGGREHALGGKPISFVPRGEHLSFPKADADLVDGARQSPYVITSICMQCHNAETQGPTYPNGAASWNSGEARDMSRGACKSEIKCTDCHDPHRAGPTSLPPVGPAVPSAADDPMHLAACVKCHEALGEPAAAAQHSHHADPAPSCLDCHMPRIVHGLSSMIRSHRISSPADPKMIEGGFPDACGMCHLDRSPEWTAASLELLWGKRPAFSAGFAPSSEASGKLWRSHREAVVRQVAADAYSRSPLGKAALPELFAILNDDSPATRLFGMLAIERLLGRRLALEEYTPWATPDVRAQQIATLAQRK